MLPRRPLGSSGIEVALLGLGGNVFGPPRLDLPASRAVVDAAADLGRRPRRHRERLRPGAVRGDPRRGAPGSSRPVRGRDEVQPPRASTAATWLPTCAAQAEASLSALRTDRIDLYQLHHAPADDVDIAEVLAVLDALVREGKVRAIGASNFSAWRLAECAELCRANGWTPFATVQNYWHLLARGIEAEVVPYAARHGLGVLPYHPLGGGYLTGKYAPGRERPAGTRGAAGSPIIDTLDTADVRAQVDALTAIAARPRAHGRGARHRVARPPAGRVVGHRGRQQPRAARR